MLLDLTTIQVEKTVTITASNGKLGTVYCKVVQFNTRFTLSLPSKSVFSYHNPCVCELPWLVCPVACPSPSADALALASLLRGPRRVARLGLLGSALG